MMTRRMKRGTWTMMRLRPVKKVELRIRLIAIDKRIKTADNKRMIEKDKDDMKKE